MTRPAPPEDASPRVPGADADHDCGFRIAEVEVRAARRRAFDEQLWRGKCLGNRRRDPRVVWRTSKRIQSVDVLALDLEGLATGAK